MNLIKNAICFATELPPVEELKAGIESMLFADVPEALIESLGFVLNPVTCELVTPLHNGLSFTVRHDKKVIPKGVIDKETNKRVTDAEEKLERELTRTEKSAIKQDVIVNLAKKAMVETKLYTSYYHQADKLLIVDCVSSPLASRIAGLLVTALGTIKTATIHVSDLKHGLTTRLKSYQGGDKQAFNGMQVGHEVKVRNPIGNEVNTYAGIDVFESEELKRSLENNYDVDSLRFTNGICNIKLTKDFQMKNIVWSMPEQETAEDEVIDKPFSWRHEADVQITLLAAFSRTLCDMFKKEPVAEPDEETDKVDE